MLPPYKTAVKEGIGAVMASFNAYEGKAMHAHKELITNTLKNELNFNGIVVSDWKGYSRFGKNDVINAGVDVVMCVDGNLDLFQQGVKKGFENGDIPQERIDDAVRRILRQKFRLGLFKNPYPDKSLTDRICLLYTSPSPRDMRRSRMPSSA